MEEKKFNLEEKIDQLGDKVEVAYEQIEDKVQATYYKV